MSNIHDYLQLESSLQLAGLNQPCSEVHGLIVGSIANHMFTGKAPDLIRLLTGSDSDSAAVQSKAMAPLQELLNQTYRETSEVLLENDDDYQILLIDADASLSIRTENLADWCRGYLLGLLQNNSLRLEQLPEDGHEIANDILAISEAGVSETESEEDEWALAELEEYVKVGTQLIFEFIIRKRSEQSPPAPVQ